MYYLAPATIADGARKARYFRDLEGLKRSYMYFGNEPVSLVKAELTAFDHNLMMQNANVFAFHEDIETTLGADLAATTTACELAGVPLDWATASTTTREVLRFIAKLFNFAQRYANMANDVLTNAQRNAFLTAISNAGLPTGWVPEALTWRHVLLLKHQCRKFLEMEGGRLDLNRNEGLRIENVTELQTYFTAHGLGENVVGNIRGSHLVAIEQALASHTPDFTNRFRIYRAGVTLETTVADLSNAQARNMRRTAESVGVRIATTNTDRLRKVWKDFADAYTVNLGMDGEIF